MVTRDSYKDFEIHDLSVISCTRESGWTSECLLRGRLKSGFLYILSGEAVFCDADGEETRITDEGLLFLPMGARYRMEYTARETTFIVVNFNTQTRSAEPMTLFPKITILEQEDPQKRILDVIKKLALCDFSKSFHSYLRKKELFYRLLGMIFSVPLEREAEKQSRIFQGVCLLEQTYLKNLPVSQYANACNLNVNTFRSLFGERFGMSPVKYRNHLRIARARELLSEEGFTVSEAAYACGFESTGYFCRCYHKTVGETPGGTRKRYFGD